MTKEEKEYIGRVVILGCFLCRYRHYGPTPAQAHHIREGAGMGKKNSHWLTVPICQDHHTGSVNGIHGQRREWKLAGVDEIDALADTIMELNKKC